MRYRRNFNNRKNIHWTLALFILILVLLSVVAIYFIKDFSIAFLLSYFVPLIAILSIGRKTPKGLGVVARILLGMLFIFSGFVKGVDPFGTAYKIEDYLIAYNTPFWFMNFSLAMGICLNLVEFLLGIMLLFNIKIKFTLVITTLMMLGFTTTTLIDAVTNLVPDCGCFGEFIKMSNWQTFYKNLTIDLLILILWFSFYKVRAILANIPKIVLAFIFAVLFLGFQAYNIFNLPAIDFRDWKVGVDMKIKNPKPVEYWVDYINNKTGETQSMLVNEIPYDSTEWLQAWTFQKQRIVDENVYPHKLLLINQNGIDETRHIIELPTKHLLIVSNNLEEFKVKKKEKFIDLCNYCIEKDYHISFLTASDYQSFLNLIEEYKIDAHFYNADDIELKTIIRSNPGIIAMQNGVIKAKWSSYRTPSPKELEKAFKE